MLAVIILLSGPLLTLALQCPPLTPPIQGVLKCQHELGVLQCVSTCYGAHVFDTGEAVVVRSCDHQTGRWKGGAELPVCVDGCRDRLLSGYFGHAGAMVTASSDVDASSLTSLRQRAVIGRGYSTWRPEGDAIDQFIQVEFPATTRINGVVIRGDGRGAFLTAFRMLFSEDGHTWYPYTDGETEDKFFSGGIDAVSEVTRVFSCPHEARFVRINPVAWEGHQALAFDLIGCSKVNQGHVCEALTPPPFTVVDCEMDGPTMYCTAYCQDNKEFQSEGPVLTRTCSEENGGFDHASFPACIDKTTTQGPPINISGFCIENQRDCNTDITGDYQNCEDCHYFSTCSHGYMYVRACPVNLKYDSISGLCDYYSRTCSSKVHRRMWLAEKRIKETLGLA